MRLPINNDFLRGGICLLCRVQFYICKSCYRGQMYCSRKCSRISRAFKCKIYRKRHRQSLEGRLDHRDAERNRRLRQKNVVDQTYKKHLKYVRIFSLMRLVAAFVAINDVGRKGSDNEKPCCSFCGKAENYVRFFNSEGFYVPSDRDYLLRQ